MLLKHQYLKFAYVDIVLMVIKMFRGNLTADMLAIGVTVVLISEIDTNFRTISAWIWYILSMPWYKNNMWCYKWKTTRGTKYRRKFERFYSCDVLRKAPIFSRWHYVCFCLVSLGKHSYLNSALIHFWWNQYAWCRKGIWWLGGVGARVWSLKDGKNMCHIYYTHYLTWQRSVLTTWTGLQNVSSRWGAFCCVNGVSKCEKTVGLDAMCTWLENLWSKNIYVCHPHNWNTHNHQSTESQQNTKTHTVHWNTQTSQPIETLKLPRQLIHPKRPAQPREALRPLSSLKYPDQIHWNMQLT